MATSPAASRRDGTRERKDNCIGLLGAGERRSEKRQAQAHVVRGGNGRGTTESKAEEHSKKEKRVIGPSPRHGGRRGELKGRRAETKNQPASSSKKESDKKKPLQPKEEDGAHGDQRQSAGGHVSFRPDYRGTHVV